MGIEEIRRPCGVEFNAELRSISREVSSINERLAALGRISASTNGCKGQVQTTGQIFDDILVRLDCLQQSVVLHRRLSALESSKHRSA